MPMDAAVFAALADELENRLRDARLDRVVAATSRELLFLYRSGPGGSRQETTLVASIDGPLARLHLLSAPPAAPRSGTLSGSLPFVLLLKRHLVGCRLVSVEHPPWERLLRLVFHGPADEFPRRRLTLVYEILGAQMNMALLDTQDVVLGTLRPTAPGADDLRLVPGAKYLPPDRPPADPGAPLSYLHQVVGLADPTTTLAQALTRNFAGLSPWAARALSAAAGLDPAAPCGRVSRETLAPLHAQLLQFAEAVAVGRFTPLVWYEGGTPRDFWVYPSPAPPGWTARLLPSTSAAVDEFFAARVAAGRLSRARQALRQRLDAGIARLERRLKAQQQDLARAEDADRLREAGELLLANLRSITRGETSFTGTSYASNAPLTVALDPRLSPSDNAQRYFDRYRKAKRGLAEAARRLTDTRSLLSRSRLARLEVDDATDLAELDALTQGLEEEGILPPARSARPGRPRPATSPSRPGSRPAPRRYRTSDGYEVLVGRNSRENDWLTLRTGAPYDLWLHVKDLAGAHVVLRLPSEAPLDDALPDRALREAAQIAAYHSEGRHSSQVPVDYTLRRHVRKAPGGGPGQVLYDHHRTIFVTPDSDLVARLRQEAARPGEPGI